MSGTMSVPGCGSRILASSTFSCDIALLRQPQDFEGLRVLHHHLGPYDLLPTEGEKHEIGNVALDPTRPALGVLHDVCQNVVTHGFDALRLERKPLVLL